MHPVLMQDLARTIVADREREMSRRAVARAADESSGPTLYQRLATSVRRLRERMAVAAVRSGAPSVSH